MSGVSHSLWHPGSFGLISKDDDILRVQSTSLLPGPILPKYKYVTPRKSRCWIHLARHICWLGGIEKSRGCAAHEALLLNLEIMQCLGSCWCCCNSICNPYDLTNNEVITTCFCVCISANRISCCRKHASTLPCKSTCRGFTWHAELRYAKRRIPALFDRNKRRKYIIE